jgi:hypothetical protein
MVDKLCALYNCVRDTRRWSTVVFFSMLERLGKFLNLYLKEMLTPRINQQHDWDHGQLLAAKPGLEHASEEDLRRELESYKRV